MNSKMSLARCGASTTYIRAKRALYYREGEMPGYQSFIRSGQRRHAGHMDQLDPGARREGDSQHLDGEDTGRDLHGVAASRGEVSTLARKALFH
jgi:hypothetical protein